jgi:hypothetical protein
MVQDNSESVARSGNEVLQFRCPTCGMHAPMDRLTSEGPFEFEVFRKTLGGKRKLTEEEHNARRGRRHGKGSAPGLIDYEPIRMTKKYRDAIARRIQELLK